MRSARSCMLVMPNPIPRRSLAIPRPSSAIDSRKPIERTPSARMTIRRARAWRIALVRASCAMPRISRSAPPENGGRSTVVSSIETSVPRRARSTMRSSAATTSSTGSCGRSAQTDRRASTMWVRARSTAVSMPRATAGGSAAAARCAPCSCIRIAAKPCASVSWISRASRLRSSSTACRRASDRLCSASWLWCRASVAWRAIASSSARCHAPSQSVARPHDSANQPRFRVGNTSGATMTESMPFEVLKARTFSGRRLSSPSYWTISVQPG